MKSSYPIQVLVLGLQVDHINPQTKKLFEEERADPACASLFVVMIRHRESKMIAAGKKLTKFKRIKKTILNLIVFFRRNVN